MKDRSGKERRQQSNPLHKAISRRRFLRDMGVVAAGMLAAGCRPGRLVEAPEPTSTVAPTVRPSPASTVTPTVTSRSTSTIAPTATATPNSTSTLAPTATAKPSATSTGAPTVTPRPAPTTAPTVAPASVPTNTPGSSPSLARVAIARTPSYDRQVVRQQVQALLDGLGGVSDVVRPGARVAIKVNLTGGTSYQLAGVPAIESFVTHPEVVRALGELLRDAGARELFIVEAVYEWDSYRLWGYEEMAKGINATLIDLNAPQPYGDFASVPVGNNRLIYESFVFNHILEEIDAFVSVSKLKCHRECGVTHSMKNLIGLVPVARYRLNREDFSRSSFHGVNNESKTRLPRIILDLNRARPIHLSLVDGIKSTEGGEGPWQPSIAPVKPGVLIAGKNPVATDAVATAVMGFDPTSEYPAAPFLRADNHLNLAHGLGLGTNRLNEIKVVGTSIDDVRVQFKPA
jgi:uncharacterized protein (DUF362 family)